MYKFKWQKLGRIWESGALCPTPWLMDDRRLRLFVGFVEELAGNRVSRIGYIDVSTHNPTTLLDASRRSVLIEGAPGEFDDNGVVPSYYDDTTNRLFYFGFQKQVKVPYTMFSGCVFNNTRRIFLDRTLGTHFRSAPALMGLSPSSPNFLHARNNPRIVAYVEGSWKDSLPDYTLKFGCEQNGQFSSGTWNIRFLKENTEIGIGRPWWLDGSNLLFFSVRAHPDAYPEYKYTIGAALRIDNRDVSISFFERGLIEAGLYPSADDWDCGYVCYASFARWQDKLYMFYNGGGKNTRLSESGIGVAVLEDGGGLL